MVYVFVFVCLETPQLRTGPHTQVHHTKPQEMAGTTATYCCIPTIDTSSEWRLKAIRVAVGMFWDADVAPHNVAHCHC